MVRIVVSDTKVIDVAGHPSLEAIDATVERTDATTPADVIAAAGDADALVVDAGTRVTDRVFAELHGLQVVGRAGTGVDNIDLDAARRHDVPVVNVPDYAVDEVATHALSLLLACLRRVGTYDRSVRAGEWDWTEGRLIERLAGGTVGIVGFGTIGRRFARRLAGFDVDILAYDPYVGSAEMTERDARHAEFEHLLREADAVSIHAPLTEETRGMFDAGAFAAMDDQSILVNTARGPIVDETALESALMDGQLAAAALDVRATEPPDSSSLAAMETVVSTPHAAWYSEQSREELNRTVASDVAAVLDGEPPANPVETHRPW